MIIPIQIDLEELARLGRNYPWPKPEACPICEGRIWWHGFVLGFFSGLLKGVWIRRMRCPDCRRVFRYRPDTHWPRFRASSSLIYRSLEHRLNGNRLWRQLKGFYQQTQWNWFSALKKNGVARLSISFLAFNPDKMLQGFKKILAMGYIPVNRSFSASFY